MNDPSCNSFWWGASWSRAAPGKGRPFNAVLLLQVLLSRICLESVSSILLFANLLTSTLPSKSGLHPFFFTGLQVKGVALDLFDNVFLLHFALETAQSVFEGFTLLQSNFRQTDTPPNPSGRTE
jgi:hypothetical protein